jgi:S-adenosylmethionine/arginine decarboxylase-like enzyme
VDGPEYLRQLTFEHAFADLGGIPANRLSDSQGLAGLLLAAANAAGLNPAMPPAVKVGPKGVSAAVLCHGGHVALHGLPEAGLCFADVAGLGGALPQRGLEVIIKRLGAREVRTDARRRGPVTQGIHPEGS